MTWTQYPKITPPEERFWALVDKSGDCWLWTGGLLPYGYGTFGLRAGKSVRVHRYAWELVHGPIPAGMTIDHECHNQSDCNLGRDCPHRRCVRPSHLKPKTHRDNNLASPNSRSRWTHCPRGHEFTPENTIIRSGTRRSCRSCHNERKRESYHRLKDKDK